LYFEPLTEIGIANFSYKADTMSGTNEISTGERLGNLVPEFLADGLHPSSAGNIVLANYLAKRLNSSFFLKQ
jgi:lysophospholipase L1-like esterase